MGRARRTVVTGVTNSGEMSEHMFIEKIVANILL